jgi:hypothetical protein
MTRRSCILTALFQRFAVACIFGGIFGVLAGTNAWSAELRLQAVDSCAEASAIGEQAENLLGRALGPIPDVDFEVDIAGGPKQAWRVRIDSVNRSDGSRRTREITGHSCAELADAAAVAIAMSVNAKLGEADAASRPREGARPEPPPSVSTSAPPAPPPAPARAPEPVRPSVGLGLAVDAGALPSVGLGPTVAVALDRGALRVAVEGTFFPSAEARLASGAGGDFQLLLGGVLGCVTQSVGRVTAAVCAGGELGRLSGQGVGVSTPRLGSTLWLAGRAEIAGAIPMGPRFNVFLRVGIAVPASRPTFVLDGATPVHQSSGVTGRSVLGIGVVF